MKRRRRDEHCSSGMADAFFLYLRVPSDSAPVILGRPMVVPTEAWDSLFGGLPRSLSRSLAMTAGVGKAWGDCAKYGAPNFVTKKQS